MLWISTVYERVPFFFSDQYEVGMEYAGYANGSDLVAAKRPVDTAALANPDVDLASLVR